MDGECRLTEVVATIPPHRARGDEHAPQAISPAKDRFESAAAAELAQHKTKQHWLLNPGAQAPTVSPTPGREPLGVGRRICERGLDTWIRTGFKLLGRPQHTVDDALVTSAPADVAGEHVAHFLLGRSRIVGEERNRGHDKPGCAEAALKPVRFPERLLHRVEFVVICKTFDRDDVVLWRLDGEHETGTYRVTVKQNGARSTSPVFAPEVRSGETELLTKEVSKSGAGLGLGLANAAVHRYSNVHRWSNVLGHEGSPARSAATVSALSTTTVARWRR